MSYIIDHTDEKSMFTGIIEEVGEITRCERAYPVTRLTVAASTVLSEMRTGDSVAVDGICLTVVHVQEPEFTVEIQQETRERTTAGEYRPGRHVNLERAVTPATRLGGHYVQGHVDDTGFVRTWRREGADWVLRVAPGNPSLLRYVVTKGFIAVNGISLTVTECDETFATHIIPHSRGTTTLQYLRVSDKVNIEVDVLAKYVESCMQGRR